MHLFQSEHERQMYKSLVIKWRKLYHFRTYFGAKMNYQKNSVNKRLKFNFCVRLRKQILTFVSLRF